MKILQINKYFYPKGGAETVFFNTIKLLEDAGHTVIPFSLKNNKNKYSEYESYFVDYPELSDSKFFVKLRNLPRFIYNKKAAKQLESLIRNEKPDIAHIHLMFNSFSVSILPVLKKYNIPVVMTAHDYRLICPAYANQNGKGEVCELCLQTNRYWYCTINRCSHGNLLNSFLLTLDSYFRLFFYSPLFYINRFIFVSKFSRYKHIGSNKLFEKKSSQLYNFTQVRVNSIDEKGDYILFYGRISEEKGISTLLEAIKQLPKVKLKIIGTGPLLEHYKTEEGENVEFLGFKSGEELYRYVAKAKFVIVPSVWYENNPMTIIEAMTLGTPVVGSNIGGIPELIEEGKTGFLFEPKSSSKLVDKIKEALSLNAEEYDAMIYAAKQYAELNFSPETHLTKLLSIYDKAINDNK